MALIAKFVILGIEARIVDSKFMTEEFLYGSEVFNLFGAGEFAVVAEVEVLVVVENLRLFNVVLFVGKTLVVISEAVFSFLLILHIRFFSRNNFSLW